MATVAEAAPNKRLARRARRLKVAELVEAGWTTRQIAEATGTSHVTAAEDVKAVAKALSEQHERDAERLRTLELARLDTLQEAVWEKATQGDLAAIEAVTLIMARRAALLGLDRTDKEMVDNDF